MSDNITANDRVAWTYTHYLNHNSSTQHTKHGEFLGCVRHTSRYRGRQLAIVQFDGNERVSRVPYSDLQLIPKEKLKKSRK